MKLPILAIILTIIITACAPKVDIDVAQPVEEPTQEAKVEEPEIINTEPEQIEEPETILEEPKEPIIEDNTIEIKEDSFYPKHKSINANTEIIWINKDTRQHKISCYLSGTRVTTSSNLNQEDSFSYVFVKEGDYTCIDAIYGLRSTIRVNDAAPLLSPTGSAIVLDEVNLKTAPIAAIALIAIIVLLVFIFRKKK